MNQRNNQNRNRNFPQKNNGVPTNDQIRHSEVRLLDSNRQLIGIMSSRDAQAKAREAGLDLIELAANAKPPVCFLGNADKFVYEKKKKEKEQKKKNKAVSMKEIQLRPNIAENDANRKLAEADKFLSQGHKVQVRMQFRGRERGRIDELSERMTQMVTEHIEHGKIEGKATRTFNQYLVTLVPVHKEKKDDENAEEAAVQEG